MLFSWTSKTRFFLALHMASSTSDCCPLACALRHTPPSQPPFWRGTTSLHQYGFQQVGDEAVGLPAMLAGSHRVPYLHRAEMDVMQGNKSFFAGELSQKSWTKVAEL